MLNHKRLLTLDLATRHGTFARLITDLRRRWGIVARREVPDNQGDTRFVLYVPNEWPATIPQLQVEAENRYERLKWGFVPAKIAGLGEHQAAWYRELNRLHLQCVPDSCRANDRFGGSVWIPFMSQCALYDPPWDRLLDFADDARVRIDVAPAVLATCDDDQGVPEPEYAMVQAPVETVIDSHATVNALLEYFEALDTLLGDKLNAEFGIDFWAMRRATIDDHPELKNRLHEDINASVRWQAIRVEAHTTEADVTGAYKLIKTRTMVQAKSNRPPRDPLVCVQCAIWYDDDGWSHKRLGKHFGWAIQYPPAQMPRCETARQHIAEGRRILKGRHKKEAA